MNETCVKLREEERSLPLDLTIPWHKMVPLLQGAQRCSFRGRDLNGYFLCNAKPIECTTPHIEITYSQLCLI